MVKRNQILIRLVLLMTHEQPRLDWGLSPHLRRNVQWGQTPTIEEISAANGGIDEASEIDGEESVDYWTFHS